MRDTILAADFELVEHAIPFKIFSGLLKAYRGADGKLRLKGVASSTVKDRHGDTMERTALEDMVTAANDNLTIFLNHSYNVPEDVAGSVETAGMIERGADNVGSPIWDLDFDIVVNETNPRAIKSFEAIESGTRLGLSIGAMIPEGGAIRNKKTGAYNFRHVDLLETSIVGIPANPRSWVQNAIKALKSQTSVPIGNPTLTLDGDRYRIEGELNGATINVSTSDGQSFGIGTIEEAAACGAPCEGGHCKKPAGHDGSHSSAPQKSAEPDEPTDHSDDPDQDVDEPDGTPDAVEPTSTPGPDEPEVQDAKIQVITIDTDDPQGKPADSQGASDSDPDDESDDDAFDSAPSADVSLAATLTESLASLEATASALVEVQRQLDVAIEDRNTARRERDEVSELALGLVSKTSQIIEKLASMPVGRKAVLREAKDDLSGLERIYGPEILKLIRSKESNG